MKTLTDILKESCKGIAANKIVVKVLKKAISPIIEEKLKIFLESGGVFVETSLCPNGPFATTSRKIILRKGVIQREISYSAIGNLLPRWEKEIEDFLDKCTK